MKGIILAGGTGTRMWPITKGTSKQLLPIYDKPLIYYPLSTLMSAEINEILIITTPTDRHRFEELLGDGSDLGIKIAYATQPEPKGLAQAFTIGRDFIANNDVALILGDNLFYGAGLPALLKSSKTNLGACIFTTKVANPENYGVLNFDSTGKPESVVEKPKHPKSNQAITGLYYFDNEVCTVADKVTPSLRGELEITSVIESYLEKGTLNVVELPKGMAWLDTGTPNSMHDASAFVRVIEERTGTKIGCLEEISWFNGWISDEDIKRLALMLGKSEYGNYLSNILNNQSSKL